MQRTSKWDGYLGLLYPSDVGYAIGKSLRSNYIGKSMFEWKEDICQENDWLTIHPNQYTMTPSSSPTYAYSIYLINNTCRLLENGPYALHIIRPVGYLKSDLKIISGLGTIDNPFILS